MKFVSAALGCALLLAATPYLASPAAAAASETETHHMASQRPHGKSGSTSTYTFTGTAEKYAVPGWATGALIEASGAEGGGGHREDIRKYSFLARQEVIQSPPSQGALVSALVPFPTGTTLLWVDVGGAGGCSPGDWMDNHEWESNPYVPGGVGGWNGGGNGGGSASASAQAAFVGPSTGGCGGGGASDVSLAPSNSSGPVQGTNFSQDALVVAAGGGGSGGFSSSQVSNTVVDAAIGVGGAGGPGGPAGAATAGEDGSQTGCFVDGTSPGQGAGVGTGTGGLGGAYVQPGVSGVMSPGPGGSGIAGGTGGNPGNNGAGGGGGGGGFYGGGGGGGGLTPGDDSAPASNSCGNAGGGGGGGGGQSFVAASAVSSSVSAAPNDLKSFPYGQNGSVSITPVSSSITVSGSTSSSPVALQPVTGSVTATGGSGPYQYTAFGTGWPEGVGITADGQLQGTPTLPGQYTLSVIATDSTGTNGYATVPLTVSPATFSSTGMPAATAGVDYDQPLPLNGTYGSGLTWTTTGLPAGVTVNTDGHLTGKFPQTGGQTFTAVGTNSSGQQITVNQTFTITVNPFTISTTSLPQACLGFPYDSQLTFNGGTPPFTWNANTPAGLTITNTGLIQGTPTTDGSSTMTLTATDANGVTGSPATLQLDTECGPNTLNITTPQSAFPEVRTYHNQPRIDVQMTAANNTGTLTWSLDSGALPDGVTITSTGKVSGTILDEEPNTWTFTIKTTDTNGKWALHTYNIIGFSDPQPTTPPTTPKATQTASSAEVSPTREPTTQRSER